MGRPLSKGRKMQRKMEVRFKDRAGEERHLCPPPTHTQPAGVLVVGGRGPRISDLPAQLILAHQLSSSPSNLRSQLMDDPCVSTSMWRCSGGAGGGRDGDCQRLPHLPSHHTLFCSGQGWVDRVGDRVGWSCSD